MSYLYQVVRSISLLICLLLIQVNNVLALEGKPNISNLILPIDEFVGRESILNNISESFQENQNIVTLVGVTGIGKSQIIRKYVSEKSKDYDIIWFFDTERKLETQYQWLAKEINLIICKKNKSCLINEGADYVVGSIRSFLENSDIRWLLVYDNLNLSSNLKLSEYIPQSTKKSKKHVLIASQKRLSGTQTIEIPPFEMTESIALLKKYLTDTDPKDLQAIATKYNNYPLILASIAKYLKENRFIESQDFLRIQNINFLNKYDNSNSEAQLRRLLSIVLDDIKEDKALYNLLLTCILIDHHNIPLKLLQDIEHNKDNNVIVNISYLNHNSIINNKVSIMNSQDTLFEMHNFLHKTFNELVDKQDLGNKLNDLVSKINNWFPKDIAGLDQVISKYPLLINNLESVLESMTQYQVPVISELEFKTNMLVIYINYMQNQSSINSLLSWIDKVSSSLDLKDRKLRVIASKYYTNKGYYFGFVQKDRDGALESYKKAIELAYDIDNEENRKFSAYIGLAQINAYWGDLINAKKEITEASNLMNQNPSLPNKGLFYHVMAKILMEEGNYDLALETIDKGVAADAKEFGINQFTAMSILLKAEIAARKGEFISAKETIKDLDENFIERIGESNELIAYLLSTKAKIECGLNNLSEAQSDIENSIKYLIQFFKIDSEIPSKLKNDELAHALAIRGEIKFQQKNYSEAIADYKLALEIYQNTYDKLNTDSIGSLLFNLARAYLEINDKFNYKKYKYLLEENFGVTHPRTKKLYSLEL